MHSSWTLALRDPASDPRVFCVGPSGRGGAWFLWRDRKGFHRPFANRGPALRWLAPGDDVAYPFEARERLFHAESSGAAAIAAGVLLLVLARNPGLRASELATLVTKTCVPGRPATRTPIGDPSDLLPSGRDPDGHDAKHGYGLLHATRACLAACDPFAFALVALGEERAAARFLLLRARRGALANAYTRQVARHGVRAMLENAETLHAACVLARHVRLLVGRPERRDAHGEGALVRGLSLFLRSLNSPAGGGIPAESIRSEIRELSEQLCRVGDAPPREATNEGAGKAASADASILDLVAPLWQCVEERTVGSAVARPAHVA